MKIIFATWPAVEYQANVLTKEGGNNRLLSYFFSRELNYAFIERYANTGVGIYDGKKSQKRSRLLRRDEVEPDFHTEI